MQIYTQTPDAAHRGFVLFQYNINFMRLAVVGAFDFYTSFHFARAWRMARNSSAATKPVSAPVNTDTSSRNGR